MKEKQITKETEEEFYFRDKVIVTNGFYKGRVGRVIEKSTYNPNEYFVCFIRYFLIWDYEYITGKDLMKLKEKKQ